MLTDRTKVLANAGLSAGDVLLVVEGNDDRTILEKMMPSLLRLRIRAVSDLLPSCSGCSGVRRVVNDIMAGEDFVVGILDRDSVRDDETIFFEGDDARFEQSVSFGPKIGVWTRGEIESYLIDCQAISWLCSSQLGVGEARVFSAQNVLELISEMTAVIARFTAFNLAVRNRNRMHKDGGDELGAKWSIDQTLSLAEMESQLKMERRWAMVVADVQQYEQKILAMASSNPVGTEPYLVSMLRALDGKAFLWRVLRRLRQPVRDSVRYVIAANMGSKDPDQGQTPREIVDKLTAYAGRPGVPANFSP